MSSLSSKRSVHGSIWLGDTTDPLQTSSVHSTLAAIVHTDFEQPIRDIPTKSVAWRRIGEQDAALEKALKDYEKTAAKLDKAQTKGSRSGKADGLASELNQITSNLSSLSPMVYTTYQRLDEDRLRALKEVLVRWGTARADMAQRDAERAERAVAVMISWEAPEEVTRAGQQLARKAGGTGAGHAAPPTISGSDRGTDSINSTRESESWRAWAVLISFSPHKPTTFNRYCPDDRLFASTAAQAKRILFPPAIIQQFLRRGIEIDALTTTYSWTEWKRQGRHCRAVWTCWILP